MLRVFSDATINNVLKGLNPTPPNKVFRAQCEKKNLFSNII